ncbi:glutamine--scyllo-inositol aminotransferase [Aneurinibacillus danicus]|uniref:Glutamine--scyllo-inositol aminotransferase n=2 Tax=Aneurinibacillus danicus TaxID=267746 RepID=A0A511V5E9_9BACL|nr:glutamine--scyllo-inositol aminotransferase [Aneurinibacillus danicus]
MSVKNEIDKKIPLLDLKQQYFDLREMLHQSIEEVMSSGSYVMGQKVQLFERAFAEYVGTKYAVALASGTDALVLTLDSLGIGPGDEVITTPFTFFSTSEAISRVGATPVFVDIDPETFNINPSLIEKRITKKTKAIIPVHLFGMPADMDEVGAIADQYELYIIEDACQAIGSAYKDKKIGSMGIAGCFSFFPTKNLGGYGDGGMMVTDDETIANKIRLLRVHGSVLKYHHSLIGYNSRLDELQAAMLTVKLAYIDEWNKQRRKKAEVYTEAFKDLPLKLPGVKSDYYSVYHLYVVGTEHRDELTAFLREHGIATGIYYPVPLHLQKVYHHLCYTTGSLPESEKAAITTMAIPLYPELTEEDQDYVISVIRHFFQSKG